MQLLFPCSIFKTQRHMDDSGADDMRCGDLSATQLKNLFHLTDVSSRVDPYTLTKITPFRQPQSMFYGSRGEGEKMTRDKCASLLFDEFRHLSQAFSFYGPYRFLIKEMITHMQFGRGADFHSHLLDSALRQQIYKDKSDKSSLSKIKAALLENIDWENHIYPTTKRDQLTQAIAESKLPKFDRIQDSINGLGITVHDTWATHITLKSIKIDNKCYRATLHYRIQDHFGLDDKDILKNKFSQFRFFRIWFLLQRCKDFSFSPFFTNMETTIEIVEGRDETHK